MVVMNVLDGLRAAAILPHAWPAASGNYEAIADVTARYGIPTWLDVLMFVGVIVWEAVAAALLWRALAAYHHRHGLRWRRIYEGFTVLLGLFLTFILMDEVFHTFKIEGDHRSIALLMLASLLALTLLPERTGSIPT